MGKTSESDFMHVCGVESCKHPRVMGTGYCEQHATVESRAALPHTRRIWLWVIATAVPAIWCLINANALDGVACTQVEFDWASALSHAFACLPEDTSEASLFTLFTAPGASAVARGLTLGGYGFAILSIIASVAFWKSDRAGH